MPLEAVIEGTVRIVIEIVVELIIKGPGHGLLRVFSPRRAHTDTAAAWVGLLFWVVLGVGGWLMLRPGG